ncbi:unnamed protein product [Lactuca virosa]|uniref:NPH3 domain-containing protein n=1 Tax=Lactuca virosa TaxID=75947 RepID=A0AAU9NHR0_9ASTR|nr:unnamed protein product [Lactuca virosa]
MKFMKLGSKPDLFQSSSENTRYVAAELATDIIVNVCNVKFYLHKFPLLSKSGRFQKMMTISHDENAIEIDLHEIPGGPGGFEICAKFCYGMTVTLNAYNVVVARCAAEYLEMHETIDKGNLVYKTEVFLDSSIFRTWKDSIIVFQTTKSLLLTSSSDELKIVNRCLDSIASKASMDPCKVEWSYTYNRTKSENGNETPLYNGVRKQVMVPKDWWVEDLCELPVDLYKKVITTIRGKGKVSLDVLGESLKAYTQRRLKNGGDDVKIRSLIETIMFLLPKEKTSVSCDFLIQLLHESVRLDCGETRRRELGQRIGQQLQNALVSDLVNLDVDLVQELVKIFMMQDQIADNGDEHGFLEFTDLAEIVSTLPRISHDGIYRAIDTFLKEHPGMSKIEKKRVCRLMDCRKLSSEACMHAIQNERLPLRIVVQILFFEQIRAGSHWSSRSGTTNTEEEWDSVPTSEELKSLKGEFGSLRIKDGGNGNRKAKGMVMSTRILSKLFSSKDKDSDNESSETSGSPSPCSTNVREMKSNSGSRSRRRSTS